MGSAGLGHTRRSSREQLRVRELCTQMNILGRQPGFKRNEIVPPDRNVELSFSSFRGDHAPQKVLCGVKVAVHEARTEDRRGYVHHGLGGETNCSSRTNPMDQISLNGDRSVGDDGLARVHRHNVGTRDQKIDIRSRQRLVIAAHEAFLHKSSSDLTRVGFNNSKQHLTGDGKWRAAERC